MPYIKDMGGTPPTQYILTPNKMRKIETEMNAAIATGRNWSKANTSVTFEGDVAEVRLHGHKIAEIGEGWIQLWSRGYETTTTKSRINAVLEANGLPGERVFQKAYQWFVTQKGGPIPFFDGMILR